MKLDFYEVVIINGETAVPQEFFRPTRRPWRSPQARRCLPSVCIHSGPPLQQYLLPPVGVSKPLAYNLLPSPCFLQRRSAASHREFHEGGSSEVPRLSGWDAVSADRSFGKHSIRGSIPRSLLRYPAQSVHQRLSGKTRNNPRLSTRHITIECAVIRWPASDLLPGT